MKVNISISTSRGDVWAHETRKLNYHSCTYSPCSDVSVEISIPPARGQHFLVGGGLISSDMSDLCFSPQHQIVSPDSCKPAVEMETWLWIMIAALLSGKIKAQYYT